MPTRHRQKMIERGYAEPRGHDKRAVKQSDALAAADQKLIDQADKDAKEAAKVADKAIAAKRAAHAARHQAEREARIRRRR